ncbi:Leucine-rich repeat-containing protein 74A [Phytophthora ramorum]|uniref:Leucine-rich repeat-containing protein 74A n=1 Tax=Phytophthora ramorum TaxID=164328 RepID=UPI0030AA4580|nr:Leucine-rich repeat-containing protein 74A [Phytophthora ramorum]
MQYSRDEVPVIRRPSSLSALGEGVVGSGGQSNRHGKCKVSWYRNSFGDTVPLPEMPPEPLALDPPMVIPPDLRPLGSKRRYLRTMQLLADPLPEDDMNRDLQGKLTETSPPRPIGRLLRHQNSMSSKRLLSSKKERKLLKSVSHKDLVLDRQVSRRIKSSNYVEEKEAEIADAERQHVPATDASEATVAAEAESSSDVTVARQRSSSPVTSAAKEPRKVHGELDGENATARALRLRRISKEETLDIQSSQGYFGKTAKQQFYAQYKQLYSRPYLFMDSRIANGAAGIPDMKSLAERGSARDYLDDTAESSIIPAYPSSIEMRKISEELNPSSRLVSRVSSSIIMEDRPKLPLRDKLSPRAHFLASCAAKSQVVVPFLIRNRNTKVFDFSFQSLGDASISAFAKSLVHDLPHVEEISVRDNRLTDDGLNELLQAVSDDSSTLNLRCLDISQNQIGPKSAQTLQLYLVSPRCTVEMLHVDNADIDDHECAAFMTAFEKNQSIKRLWMSRNCIGKAENLNVVQPDFTTGGEAIAQMLHVNTVLVHLDLSWNYLRLESSIALANSIRDNGTLIELKLAYNACADAGAMMFGEALRFNKTLQVLDLSYNSIGVKGAMVLGNAIRSNRALRSLQLNGNNIGREGGQLLMAALCANQTEVGCTIELHACNLGANIMPIGAAAPVLPKPSAGISDPRGLAPHASTNGEFNVQDLPVFNAKSTRVFNPREPAGRYSLNLRNAYDKMIAMELVRLATTRKGCRFLRIEYKTPTSSKRPITLIKKENLVVEQHKGAGAHRSAESNGEETTLETRGLDALFANVDRDKSGYIDQDELMAVLNQIGLFPRMESLESMLQKFDYNKSGFIDEGEFSAFFFHAVFQMIDEDQSGKIDADEVEEAFKMLGIHKYDENEIANAITTYDISGDGEMEEYEFVEFMKSKLLERIKNKLLGYDGGEDDTGDQDRVPLVSLLDASTQKPWIIPEDGQLEVDFLYDREAFATNDEAYRQGKISRVGLELLIRNITEVATSKSEQDDLFHVAMYDSEVRLTAAQAYQVLDACHYLKPESKKIETIALLLPQMLTAKEAQILVARTLTLMQRCRLKARMGSAYSVVLGNPTSHYSFDLAKHKDRIALTKLAEVAQSEKLFSKSRSGRADTSQHGNWENFRNEELDGRSIVLTNTFFHSLPRRGKLCFDYVSTTRPKRGTTQISERRFDQLIEILQMDVVLPDALGALGPTRSQRARGHRQPKADVSESKAEKEESEQVAELAGPLAAKLKRTASQEQSAFWNKTRASILKRGWDFVVNHAYTFRLTGATKENVGLKMVQIESAICDRWLSCDQASKIIACMPATFHARPETARILFSRLIDLHNFHRIYDAMPRSEQQVCASTLGWLNMMNPMAPERFYALNLAVYDEREMTKVLVDLAIGEPGENWLNQNFTLVQGEPGIPGWKLPARWEKEDNKEGGVNRAGFLELEYYSGQDRGCAPVVSLRKTLMKRVLCGTRLYCL